MDEQAAVGRAQMVYGEVSVVSCLLRCKVDVLTHVSSLSAIVIVMILPLDIYALGSPPACCKAGRNG